MLTRSLPTTVPLVPASQGVADRQLGFRKANCKKPPRFMHVATHLSNKCDSKYFKSGLTMWCTLFNGVSAHMAWDWIEIGRGTIAMVDPMNFMTNMRVL